MVALCVRSIDQRPVTCNARPLLHDAHTSLERGDVVSAGCKLREAIRRWLYAECEYHGCVPAGRADRIPPRVLAKALKKSGELGPDCYEWVVEAIDVGNQAAHLKSVHPSLIECCLSLLHSFLDSSTYLQQPVAAGRLS